MNGYEATMAKRQTATPKPTVTCGHSRTHTEFKEECDINRIMEHYRQTGDLTHISQVLPKYGDFSNVLDFQGALAQVERAESLFLELPALIRKRFENNPAYLIDFMADGSNEAEALSLGLLPRVAGTPPEVRDLPEILLDNKIANASSETAADRRESVTHQNLSSPHTRDTSNRRNSDE